MRMAPAAEWREFLFVSFLKVTENTSHISLKLSGIAISDVDDAFAINFAEAFYAKRQMSSVPNESDLTIIYCLLCLLLFLSS